MLKVASNPSLRKDVHRKVGVFSFFIFIFFINFALRIKRGGAVKNRNEKNTVTPHAEKRGRYDRQFIQQKELFQIEGNIHSRSALHSCGGCGSMGRDARGENADGRQFDGAFFKAVQYRLLRAAGDADAGEQPREECPRRQNDCARADDKRKRQQKHAVYRQLRSADGHGHPQGLQRGRDGEKQDDERLAGSQRHRLRRRTGQRCYRDTERARGKSLLRPALGQCGRNRSRQGARCAILRTLGQESSESGRRGRAVRPYRHPRHSPR